MRLAVVALLGACAGPLPPREVRGPAAERPVPPHAAGKILVAEHAGRGGHLVFVDESGRRLSSLTEPPEGEDSFDITPAWSADGKLVAFASSRGSARRAAGLWLVPADGTAPARRLTSPETGIDFQPAFSPDGQTLAYTASHGPSHAVYVIPIAGGEPRLVSEGALKASFSHDGKTLVVTRQARGEDPPEVWLVTLDGGEAHKLTDGADGVFSPDDQRVAFVARTGRADGDLWIIGRDGQGRERLVDDKIGDETSPRFSADGRFLFSESYVRDADAKAVFPCIVYVDLAEPRRRLRALLDRNPGGWTSLALAPVPLDAEALDRGPPYAEALARALVALPPD